MNLHHRRQPLLYGCMYHATYALLGEEILLEDVSDVSPLRWQARLAQFGLIVATYYEGELTGQRAGPDFWGALRGRVAGRMDHLPLLLSVPGPRHLHMVAALVPMAGDGEVQVSDSARDGVLRLPWADFLASPYGQPLTVQVLAVTDPGAYASEPGADHVSTADPACYAM